MESIVNALIGSILLAGGVYLAMRPRAVADAIQDYYANLAKRKRNWPQWLAWQPSPGRTASLAMAWALIAISGVIGLAGVVGLFLH